MRVDSVVTWKWRPPPDARAQFRAEHVNVLFRMIDRWYPERYRRICVTDDPVGIDPAIEIVPLWDDLAHLGSPHGRGHPSCYRRLRAFDAAIADVFGSRFVWVDLDAVVTGDLRPLWQRSEDFVMWGDTNPRTHYNGSMCLMTAGARRQVWDTFNPQSSPSIAKHAGCFGSDQAWISYCLGGHETKWTKADGVYSFRNDLARHSQLPRDARIVFFHGRIKPWEVNGTHPWVKAHWR